jgi:hypothetical protein
MAPVAGTPLALYLFCRTIGTASKGEVLAYDGLFDLTQTQKMSNVTGNMSA